MTDGSTLLTRGAAQGQKIYTLNQGNQNLHAAILQTLQIDQDVKTEIANALVVGKEVSVHEKNINVNGWIGSGYTILDPTTGAGAYKIAGGANGGDVPLPSVMPGLLLGLLGGIAAIVMSTVALAAIAGVAAFVAAQLLNATYDKKEKLDFAAGRFLGTAAGLLLAIILGQYVIFTLSPLFVIGLAILMITLVSLLVSVLVDALSSNMKYSFRRRLV